MRSVVSPIASVAAAGDAVRAIDQRHFQFASVKVGTAAAIVQHIERPAAPMAMPTVPSRHGRLALSVISTAMVRLGRLASGRVGFPLGAGVGVDRQQQCATIARRCGRYWIDRRPAWAPTKPQLVAHDEHARPSCASTSVDSSRMSCTRRGSLSVCLQQAHRLRAMVTRLRDRPAYLRLSRLFFAQPRRCRHPRGLGRIAAMASSKMVGRSSSGSTSPMPPNDGSTEKPVIPGCPGR